MKKFQIGLQEAMYGIIGGIFISALLMALAKDGLVPTYFVWLFILVGLAANIATFRNLQFAGTVYTIGWLLGGLLLKDILGTTDFILYIAVPIGILCFRIWQLIKSFL